MLTADFDWLGFWTRLCKWIKSVIDIWELQNLLYTIHTIRLLCWLSWTWYIHLCWRFRLANCEKSSFCEQSTKSFAVRILDYSTVVSSHSIRNLIMCMHICGLLHIPWPDKGLMEPMCYYVKLPQATVWISFPKFLAERLRVDYSRHTEKVKVAIFLLFLEIHPVLLHYIVINIQRLVLVHLQHIYCSYIAGGRSYISNHGHEGSHSTYNTEPTIIYCYNTTLIRILVLHLGPCRVR